MRWDFGFTCAFCLLHEADLYGGQPGEGLGGTTVEHRVARSEDRSLENDYGNCLYACRFCNRSRSAKSRVGRSGRLLDPTGNAWADHFSMVRDHLRPVEGDADALYTHDAYELDDPRKVQRRQARWALLHDRVRLLESLETEIGELLRLADVLRTLDLRRFRQVLEEIRELRIQRRRALEDLKRFAAVPGDHPRSCRCATTEHHTLPGELERQLIEVRESYL